MADNSSSSSCSSESSSSSGVIQSPLALLEAVEAAILTVSTSGQSYRIGDRTFERANLKELQSMRAELKLEVAETQRKTPRVSYADVRSNF